MALWLLAGGLGLLACGDWLRAIVPPGLLPDNSDAGPEWKVFQPDRNVANWKSVWAPRHDTAYMVGDRGAIVRWRNGEFTRIPSGTDANLESIWGRSETDIFVVGQGGIILHGDGNSFSPVTEPDGDGGQRNLTKRNLFTVFGDRDLVFMAGERGEMISQDADGGLFRMVNETTIRSFPICESRVLDVTEQAALCTTQLVPHGTPDGGVSFGPDRYPGCGTPPECCIFDGGQTGCCLQQRCDPDGGPLEGRVGVDSDLKAGWASGDFGVVCGAGGAIYEWRDGDQGRKWYKNELAENTPYTRDSLAAAWGSSVGNVLCAGQDGRLMQRTNGDWQTRAIPTPVYVQGMWGTSSRDIYAVGFSGVLLRQDRFETFRDAGWYDEDVRVTQHLRAVTGVRLDFDGGPAGAPDGGPPTSRVWVVGSEGIVLIKN